MYIRRRRGWEIPECQATPEDVFLNRRTLLAGAGSIAALAALPGPARAAGDPTADLYPATRNPKYRLSRPVTPEKINSTYNNFYEFGSHKRIYEAAQALQTRPWDVVIDGDVEQEMKLPIDALIRKMQLEERLYRHRCVEAWSMTVPWSGFPMKDLVSFARPLARAKYVRMETFKNPEVASGQRADWYPWPYVEGLTMAEATNELAFLVTGAYGKPMAKQFGAPLRLAVPWKYGFKHIKSIVRFHFTATRPKSFWEEIQGREYGFWANVNPAVSHPRWSQASERVLGTDNRIPTQIYNGYGEYVAHLYKGLEKRENLWR
ncbi:MAG: protein-methionine-sulfoxide reductase catalytic subunit MsrP [Methyloligellaceae bacterium]